MEKSHLMYKSFEKMHVAAVGLSESELLFGASFLKDLGQKYSVDLICANLVNQGTDTNAFLPYKVIEKNGLKILVTSVLDPFFIKIKDSSLELTDPVKALKKVESSTEHDLFIAMLHTYPTTAKQWVKQVPGINLALLGFPFGVTQQAIVEGDTTMVYNNYKGEVLSHVDIDFDKNSHPISIQGPVNTTLEKKLIQENMGIKEWVDQFKAWVLSLQRDEAARNRHMPTFYLGYQFCTRCHGEITKSWLKTAHAKAYETLEKEGKAEDKECLVCHVTDLEEQNIRVLANGSQSINLNPNMVGVQCEACHGPAGMHTQNPKIKLNTKIDENTCKKCHNQNRDPHFDFLKDKPIGTHIIPEKKEIQKSQN